MPFIHREGSRIRYDLKGSGPPVLFIQGVGVTGSGWNPQMESLSGEFTTVLFDNRGIGGSVPCTGSITVETMAADARALMDHLGCESAHVVGHSMGGVIAQQLALDCPLRVRSLTLMCTFVRGKDAAKPTPWVIWMSMRTRIGTRRMRRRAFLEMIASDAELRTANIDALAERVGSLVGRDLADNPPILMKQLGALSKHDTSARLAELEGIPTLVMSAQHDRIAPTSQGRALAAAIPGATYEEIPDRSHGVPLLDPGPVNLRLASFFKEAGEASMTGRSRALG